MPLTMTANLTSLKNQLSQSGAWVWLLTIALPEGGPTLRYVANTEDVVYAGLTYTAFAFAIDGFTCNSDGEIPEFTMSVSNIGYVIQGHMRTYNGLIGSTVSFVQVNSEFLAEDYSEDLTTLTVVGAQNTWPDLQLTLSVPPGLRGRVPEDRFNPHACRHAFRTPAGEYASRCGYSGHSIVSVMLAGTGAVSIEVTGHSFITGDRVRVYHIVGTTGGLAGDYVITVTDADHFTLNGTVTSSFAGSFVSGNAGYAQCKRVPIDCSVRGRFPDQYGGPLSLRREAVRYA